MWAALLKNAEHPWQHAPRLHVFPLFDIHVHTASMRCECKPVEEEDDPCVITHNAMDQRAIEGWVH